MRLLHETERSLQLCEVQIHRLLEEQTSRKNFEELLEELLEEQTSCSFAEHLPFGDISCLVCVLKQKMKGL